MTVTDDLKELFDKKLKKFDKFFRDEAEATIVLSERKNGDKRLELTLSSNGTMFRSEETNTTFQNALDRAIDAIERQIRKNRRKAGKEDRTIRRQTCEIRRQTGKEDGQTCKIRR